MHSLTDDRHQRTMAARQRLRRQLQQAAAAAAARAAHLSDDEVDALIEQARAEVAAEKRALSSDLSDGSDGLDASDLPDH